MAGNLDKRMPINAANVIAARTKKGWSQTKLAKRIGVSQQTIDKIENGKSKTSRYIARIAAALDVEPGHLDPDYVLAPQEVEEPSTMAVRPQPVLISASERMPVYASAEGSNGDGALILEVDPIEYVPKPQPLENVRNAYGILIEGESMEPAYEAGDTAWINPVLGPRRNTDVILYVNDDMGSGEKRAVIKRLVTWNDTHWTLRQYNPPKDFQLPRDPWRVCHRVIGKLSKR